MASIRDYDGKIYLCSNCGQPCYEGDVEDYGTHLQHFSEQWDGVHCPMFPLAGDPVAIEWDDLSLQTLKEQYPDTHPDRPGRRRGPVDASRPG